ncbi:hypothetical protein Hypma_005790 [Hypsizygus marmoreus]|uniref:Uncharacterized protein n=1 Tax=Hypsizygus marmoreus TaxID=39966 RepID=A0A369K883_HYPMA|nr:hypothetical protein Hypma_005790 [Hypsizygus marmoreus]
MRFLALWGTSGRGFLGQLRRALILSNAKQPKPGNGFIQPCIPEFGVKPRAIVAKQQIIIRPNNGCLLPVSHSWSLPGTCNPLLHRPFARTVVVNRRSSSHSAIGHLISGSSTTAWLYDDAQQIPGNLPELSNEALVDLVQEKKYGAADRLRIQLLESGVEIEPHPIYEQAAISNLQWSNVDQCIAHFTTWFSFVPAYDHSNPPVYPGPFIATRRALLQSGEPVVRLPVILRFGVIAASLGYVDPILQEILDLLVRFSTPEVGAAFMHDVENAAVQYWLARQPERADAASRNCRSLAIHCFCQAGWLSQAIQFMRLDRDYDFAQEMYILLLDSLRKAGRRDDVDEVEHMYFSATLRGDRRIEPSTSRTPFRLNVSHPERTIQPTQRGALYTVDTNDADKSLPSIMPVVANNPNPPWILVGEELKDRPVSRATVAFQLRFISRWLKRNRMPEIIQIIRFMDDLTTVGGSPRVIVWLRHRALRKSEYLALNWMKAELRYNNIEEQYEKIVGLFLAYLTPMIPLPDTFSRTLAQIVEQKNYRIPESTYPKHAFHDRWLLMKAIIKLALDLPNPERTIRKLYSDYLHALSKQRTFTRERSEVLSTLISAFGRCSGADAALQVLNDARMRGRVLNQREYEVLIGVLAQAGKSDKAIRMLKEIEKGSATGQGLQGMGPDGEVKVVTPRLTTYGRAIEGFVEAGLLEPALEVEGMMKRTLSYTYGLNKRLDAVMRSLWDLEMRMALGEISTPSTRKASVPR